MPFWCNELKSKFNYSDVIMSAMASQITGVSIVYSTVCSGSSKKTSKLRVTGLCEGNSPVTGEFPAQRASNADNVSIWWRNHAHMSGIVCSGCAEFQVVSCDISSTTIEERQQLPTVTESRKLLQYQICRKWRHQEIFCAASDDKVGIITSSLCFPSEPC